mgnify:CR=1 FL=1
MGREAFGGGVFLGFSDGFREDLVRLHWTEFFARPEVESVDDLVHLTSIGSRGEGSDARLQPAAEFTGCG